MMPLTVGFDRIRLLRRKILINRQEIAVQSVGKARDAAVLHAAALTEELLTECDPLNVQSWNIRLRGPCRQT